MGQACDECRFGFAEEDLVECPLCGAMVCEGCRPGHAKVENGYNEKVDHDDATGFF